jgi:phage shock protein PspC (stress-responsive transcriptional regulator)
VTERLYRHPTDRVIAGVAGGLATWLNIDPSLVRIAWVLLAIFSGGAFVLVYIVMMIVVPLPPPGWVPRPRDAGRSGPSGGWGQPGSSAGWGQPGSSATWGPTAAPGGAPNAAPGYGEAPHGGWDQPAAPAWGDPAAPAAGTGLDAAGTGLDAAGYPRPADAASWGPAASSGHVPGWGANTAPTTGSWSAPKPGNAGIVAGVVLVGLGVWFLVDQYVSIDWDLLWPVAIMVLGGALIAGALVRGRNA